MKDRVDLQLGSLDSTYEIVKVCCASAARYERLPAWNASIVHVPAAFSETVFVWCWIEHAPGVDDGSIAKNTGLPEGPPVAVTW